MKRNQNSSRAMRHKHIGDKPDKGKSRYAQKKRSGKQLYGPGCCAHKIGPLHNQDLVKKRLRERGDD